MPYPMPQLDRAAIDIAIRAAAPDAATCEEWMSITDIVIKKDGTLRASKPKSKTETMRMGCAIYIWRMVAFALSRRPQHQMMPSTADFWIPAYNAEGKWSYREVRKITDALKPLEDAIVKSVPVRQQAGTMRWGRAFGMVS